MDNEKNGIIRKRITVYGIVQGVGFRPLVYRLAEKHNIKGTVRNLGGLAEIMTQSSQEELNGFLNELRACKDGGMEMVKLVMEEPARGESWEFGDFSIISSSSNEEASIIPPDLPVCPECRKELFDEGNRRFLNPFVSCMSCGPRYTIIEELPYDRVNTAMKDFDMCPACNNEYTSPDDRRFHAQTISCYDCGPCLIFDGLKEEQAFHKAADIIKAGGIIAVKGIGGYHFACSPFREDTVNHLRELKGREEKPFAVMFDSPASVREHCLLSEEERELLESKARPIVLLYSLEKDMAYSTNKGSVYIGAFLPYTPLQILLTKHCGPLVMTSANLSGKPIIKEDSHMLSVRSPYLDGVLYHERRIVRSVDDSVARIIDRRPQLIRRSRGYVPYPVFLPESKKEIRIFAAGGDLKAAFCLYKGGNAVVSQYFGDLEESDILQEYKTAVTDLSGLLKISPDIAVCDLHPNYLSSKYARELGIPVIPVQHHHAHIASVMAEYGLSERVIGIAFDGTGYGTDGNIWGGEVLICDGAEFTRAAHLCYTPLLGGDRSMRDAAKTAACFLINTGLEEYCREEHSDIIRAALKARINTVLSSSMGRLFDAVASILNVQDYNSYEGECAAKLEKAAVLAIRAGKKAAELSFAINRKGDMIEMDPKPLLESLCRLPEDTESLALGFHYAVSDAVVKVCDLIRSDQGPDTVALSGGVFQNTVLTEHLLKNLRAKGFHVYMNAAVPPNDGSISLGQAFIGLMEA